MLRYTTSLKAPLRMGWLPLVARRLVCRCVMMAGLAAGLVSGEDARERADFFEREVRPVLADSCFACHGAKKQEADLRLDSRERILQGGVSGPAMVPGQPENSLLVKAIRHDGDLKMPPRARLTESQIAVLAHWVKLGGPWTSVATPPAAAGSKDQEHWAFQPLRDPQVPIVEGNDSPHAVDAFVRAKLSQAGLEGSLPADRHTLLRRASFSLTGLPPSPEEMEAFVRDTDPQAYEKVIERLLSRPQYGEHWGRHWLDVARYSDTKGYVYAREQRHWVHAWVYRDWVVQALNDDLPYDQFLLLQIAADQAAPDDRASLAAMGFLTLGRRFLGVTREIIDDRIDVLTRGTMGLTVACARCHDHKYDPIPAEDYYSLYGVFASCAEQTRTIAEPRQKSEKYQQYAAELAQRREQLAETMAARRLETANRNRARVGDYLAAQLELHKYPAEGFDQILAKTDLLPTFVRRWQAYLREAGKASDPVFAAWHAYGAIPPREFAAQSMLVTRELLASAPGALNALVAERFASPPASMAEVAARYGEVLASVEQRWQEELEAAGQERRPPPARLTDDAAESLRQVLYGSDGPCEVPDEPIVNIEYFFDSGSCNELWRLQNQVDSWILQSPPEVRHAIVLTDRERPSSPLVFKRGNPANLGDEVPRQFVAAVAGKNRQPFTIGSGRLELARAIVDPQNPLTARVLVNRVWAHHFGVGLVRTASDFGTRADPPSHPELLDWLTCRFLEDGWSLKQLHRRILRSETYRQAAQGPASAASRAKAVQHDPENRLLWRMNVRRLTFEEMRDSLLTTAGKRDDTVGGRPGDLLSPSFTRRSLYGSIDRQFLPSTLRVFDFANPDLHIPIRGETTVPQQALFFLNHPLVLGYARALAARTEGGASDARRIQEMYRWALQRAATPREQKAALELIQLASPGEDAGELTASSRAWQYGYGAYDEALQRVANFEKLPHFTGSAWQGGADYPAARLGWLQLTAVGGHPGNDLAHAAVRRWTAPCAMRVTVKSTLVHEPKQGQGVRAFLVGSRKGLLGQATVQQGKAELNVEALDVEAGDTLDFVADRGQQLSHNQFLWKATITADDDPQNSFDSVRDFAGQGVQKLTPWEQLAQVLLAANEFVFVE